MKLYPVGSKAIIGGDIEAKIVEIIIGANKSIRYKCVWWNGRTRTSEWLDECEIDCKDDKILIGFHEGNGKAR